MKNKTCCLVLTFVISALLCSCGQTPSEVSTMIPPAIEDIHTSLPSPESTSTPAETEIPSATPTTAPFIPLSQEGPWLVIYADEGAWAANADGTGLTQFANSDEYRGRLKLGISSRGGRLAFFYPPFIPPDIVAAQPELFLVEFPQVTPTPLTRLYSSISLAATESTDNPYEMEETIYSALVWWNELSWSPDGKTLAFASGQDGPSVDLYVYSTLDNTISRLTNGPTQTININWSPDGQYIVFGGAENMHAFSGGSNGPELDCIWIVRPDGSDLHSIYTYISNDEGAPSLIGWVNNRAYLENYGVIGCGNIELTLVDIQTPAQYTLIPGAFSSLALDPVTGTVLVLIPNITDEYSHMRDCGPTLESGLYLMSVYDSVNPERISFDVPSTPDNFEYSISWSPEVNLFFLFTGLNVYTVDLQGHIELADLPNTYESALKPSPNGSEWAGYGEAGLWIAFQDQSVIEITSNSVNNFIWTPDGSALLFISENSLYLASAPDYQPALLAGPIASWNSPYEEWQLAWVMP